MTQDFLRPIRPGLVARGFTMVETIISVVIVATMFVAVLNSVAASRTTQYKMNEQRYGNLWARALMSEILAQDYEEPVDTVAFGLESPETSSSRADWDDVDEGLKKEANAMCGRYGYPAVFE